MKLKHWLLIVVIYFFSSCDSGTPTEPEPPPDPFELLTFPKDYTKSVSVGPFPDNNGIDFIFEARLRELKRNGNLVGTLKVTFNSTTNVTYYFRYITISFRDADNFELYSDSFLNDDSWYEIPANNLLAFDQNILVSRITPEMVQATRAMTVTFNHDRYLDGQGVVAGPF